MMKLAINYEIQRTNYRVIINVDKYSYFDVLDETLDTICQKIGKIDRYVVSKIVEEVPIGTTVTLENTTVSLNFEISKEEILVDVENPCEKKDVKKLLAEWNKVITEWDDQNSTSSPP